MTIEKLIKRTDEEIFVHYAELDLKDRDSLICDLAQRAYTLIDSVAETCHPFDNEHPDPNENDLKYISIIEMTRWELLAYLNGLSTVRKVSLIFYLVGVIRRKLRL